MMSEQVLCVLFNWPALEERARRAHLPRLQGRNGALLLKILLLAFINGARAAPLKKRALKAEIAEAYRIAPETVDERIKDLEAIGFVTTTSSADPREVIIIASEKARGALWRYGCELTQALRTVNAQIASYGQDDASAVSSQNEFDIVRELAHMSALEVKRSVA
jgi:DNA-binding MarR family transcriptional regulator